MSKFQKMIAVFILCDVLIAAALFVLLSTVKNEDYHIELADVSISGDYTGWWSDGVPNGNGKLKTSRPYAVYKGEWKNGIFGNGFVERNGETLWEFKDGKRNGRGELQSPNGLIWNGEFKDGNSES